MTSGLRLEKITGERNDRNKSAYVWFNDQNGANGRIKLEIGSSIRPDPYQPMAINRLLVRDCQADGQLLFELAISTFNKLNQVFAAIGE